MAVGAPVRAVGAASVEVVVGAAVASAAAAEARCKGAGGIWLDLTPEQYAKLRSKDGRK